MSETRKRVNRFPPRSEVPWLEHPERKSHRNTIKILSSIASTLERSPDSLSPEQQAFLGTITDSKSLDTRLNAAWNAFEKTEAAYMQKLAVMAPYDLTAYHELLNPHEPPATHHIYLCDHLMRVEAGEIKTLIVAMSPGTAKSTYASRTFAQWYLGRNPDRRLLAVGHSQKWAEDELSKPNRNAMDTDLFRLAFPDVYLNPNEKSASFWRLDGWRGSYACRGVGSGVSGLRANLVLGDDLYKHAQDAMSEVIRAASWRWWSADVMSRRLPDAAQILVNTRWHSEDVAGHIEKLDKEARQQQVDQPWVINPIPQPCVIINIPAEAKEDDPLGRKPGEWIWCKDQQPDGFYPISHYENMRATMPASLWSALYLGEPIDKHGDFVAEDQFQRYETIPANKEGKPREFVKTIISVDAAQSSKERADNTAILVFRVRVDGVHCLVDQWAGKKNLDDLVQHLSKMMKAWEVNYAIIENSGMGVQLLENYQGKLPAPLVSYTPAGKGSKDFRFDAAVPLIISGKILFPKQAPWLNDLMAEFISFPNGSNDDRVDAFSQYCDHEMKIRIGGTKSLKMRG